MRRSVYYLVFYSIRVAIAANTTQCNGYESLCSKPYSNVTFLGAHNSYAVGSSISDNQDYDVTTQLNDGIRLLQGQGHNGTNKLGSMIELCHSSCALQDGGTLEAYLTKVKAWVVANPREVLTILWVNSDNMPAAHWAKAYVSTGLASFSYAPSNGKVSSWPSLQNLIAAGTPVINFLTSQTDYSTVPYLLGEWDNIWETPYDNTNNAFTCELDRGTRPNQLYLANHFVYKTQSILGSTIDSPDTANIGTTNSIANMNTHAQLCASQNSRYPNFFLVDYYDRAAGGTLEAVAGLNNVQYTQKTLGNGKASSSIQRFFGGQNEIRNIAIVSAAGALAFIVFWIGCCCFCCRRRRRKNSVGNDSIMKPLHNSAAHTGQNSQGSVFAPSSSSSYPRAQTNYMPVTETHEMTENHGYYYDGKRAFDTILERARPLPTPPTYQSYSPYRGSSPNRSHYQRADPWYDQRSVY